VTTPAPPGLIRPDTDPLPEPIALEGGIGQLRRAVAYSAPAGFRPLELDPYTPIEQPAPVIVFLHGGGWRLGSRDVFVPTWSDWHPDPFRQLVAAGFAVASIDYRLSGEAVFPAQLDDAQAAVAWLRTRADEVGIDPTRVVAWGESAGAHLAALLGLTGRESASTAMAGVVDWYGPADLTTMAAQALPTGIARSDAPDSRESLLIGAPVGQAPELARRASPVSYVHPEAPPFHIAHGDADRFVPSGQSRQLADALRAAGVEVEFSEVTGADHLWMGATDPGAIFDAAVGFARRVTDR
jgi:acetyl esterase/lipase